MAKLFEGESDQFYFATRGADLTRWTQRRHITPKDSFCPVWRCYDPSFVWNHRILADLANHAVDYLQTVEGLPPPPTSPPTSPRQEPPEKSGSLQTTEFIIPPLSSSSSMPPGASERTSGPPSTRLAECLAALEEILVPVVNGFVKQVQLELPRWDVHGVVEDSSSVDHIRLTLVSRRSQFRAGKARLIRPPGYHQTRPQLVKIALFYQAIIRRLVCGSCNHNFLVAVTLWKVRIRRRSTDACLFLPPPSKKHRFPNLSSALCCLVVYFFIN